LGRYRLAAIDVDGTLIERGKPVSPRVHQAIARAQGRGAIVTLASGRMFPLLKPLVESLELRSPVICYGGALVVDPTAQQAIYQRGVPLDLAREVIRAARARQLVARAYLGDQVFVDKIDPMAFNYESLRRLNAIAVGDLIAFLSDDPTHLAIDAPPDQTRRLVLEMRQIFSPRLHVTTGHPLLTEFSHPEVHKGSALAWLAEKLHIPREETLAIGDDWNDVEMLRYAGLGIAIGNAHPDVLALADATVPGVADDGVAVALEQFVL
jgi:Cof subfamily protein (haloacid dehalogenase superfamily)